MATSINSNIDETKLISFKSKNEEKKKNRNLRASTAAVATALCIDPIQAVYTNKIAIPNMRKVDNLTEDVVEICHKAAEKVIKEKGLADNGVKIEYLKEIPITDKKLLKRDLIAQVHNGSNACCILMDGMRIENDKMIPISKGTILAPEKKLSLAVFHEIGHAHNLVKSKFSRVMQKVRIFSPAIALSILAFSAFTRTSKPEDDKELTKAQKTKNFIRNNAGKLTVAAMLPVIIEETTATIKGQKFVKEFLPDFAQKTLKSNIWGLSSYITATALFGLASFATVKIKDKMLANQENKKLVVEKNHSQE